MGILEIPFLSEAELAICEMIDAISVCHDMLDKAKAAADTLAAVWQEPSKESFIRHQENAHVNQQQLLDIADKMFHVFNQYQKLLFLSENPDQERPAAKIEGSPDKNPSDSAQPDTSPAPLIPLPRDADGLRTGCPARSIAGASLFSPMAFSHIPKRGPDFRPDP